MSNSTSKPRWAMQLGGTIIAVLGLIASLTAFASASTTSLQQGTAPVITAEFCLRISLGGAATYPLDVNGDGVHDICSLAGTRRETAARQNAMEQLASEFPLYFGQLWATECLRVEESYSAAERDKELTDECAAPRRALAQGQAIPPVPRPRLLEANTDPRFFSGPVVTGPSFCLNLSFGGPVTYPLDVTGDGVADICSLPTTRRATIARQHAFERLAAEQPELLNVFFVIECQRVPHTLATTAREARAEQEDGCATAQVGPSPGGGSGGGGGGGGSGGGGGGGTGGTGGGGPGGTTGPITPPSIPVATDPATPHDRAAQEVHVASRNEGLVVAWQAPYEAAGSVYEYHIEWSTSLGNWQRLVMPDTDPLTTPSCTTTPAVFTTTSSDYECTISNLNNFDTYYVRIKAVRGANDVYTPSTSTSRTPAATPGIADAPSWAATPLAQGGYGELVVNWAAPLANNYSISHYNVQWSTSNGGWSSTRQAAVYSGTTYTIEDLTNRTYYVRLQAVTNETGPGTWSLARSFTLSGTSPAPGAPTNVMLASAGTGTSMDVSWTAPTAGTVTHYIMQWSTSSSFPSDCASSATCDQRRTAGTNVTDTITSLNIGTRYWVRVQAVNTDVAGSWSTSANITLGEAKPPTNLNWIPGGSARDIELSWTAPVSAPGVSYYFVQWSTSSGFSCTGSSPCGTATVSGTSHTFSQLNNANLAIDDTYYVRIRTVNTNNDASVWSPTLPTIPGAVVAPTISTVDETVGNPRQLFVTWTSAAPGDRPVQTGFRVRWKASDATNWGSPRTLTLTQAQPTANNACTGTTYCYTITGLTGGTQYDVQVLARNTHGFGPWSNSSQGTPGNTFTIEDLAVGEDTDNPRALALTWSRTAWGVDADTDPIPVTGFRVRWKASDATNWGSPRPLSLTQAGSSDTNCANYCYSLPSLAAGTQYDVQVSARNASGDGPWSGTQTGTPGTSFVVTIGSANDVTTDPRALNVTWSFTASTPTGFKIRWKASDATTWGSPRTLTLVQASDGCTYCYILTGLTPGTQYDVQVLARSGSNDGPWSDSTMGTPGTLLAPSITSPSGQFTPSAATQTLVWGAPGTIDTPLVLRSYTVQWRSCGRAGTTCADWSTTRQHTTATHSDTTPTPTTYDVTGLSTRHTHEWRVRTNFTNGTSSAWVASN